MVIYKEMWYWPHQSYRRIHIYLPDDYHFNEKEKYPVMYFFDGQNLFFDEEATFGKSWGLNGFLSQWDKKMIIVGLECAHENNDRLSEYFPYSRKMFKEQIDGLGDQTMEWLIYNVKPMIDNQYRTYSFREASAIGGSSLGGIMAMYAVIKYNQFFSKAACVSASVYHNLSSFRKTLEEAVILPDTRIFISWGEHEAGQAPHNGNPEFDTCEARSVHKFERELQARGAQTYYYFQRDGGHSEESWQWQVPVFMEWLWK